MPGMEENSPSTNANTPFFRNFVSNLNLAILNTLPMTKGLFTYFMERPSLPPSKTVLDYGLMDQENLALISSFVIDEEARYLCGTDHSLMTAILKFGVTNKVTTRFDDVLQYRIPSDNFTNFHEKLDKELSAITEDTFSKLSLEEQHYHLDTCLSKTCQKELLSLDAE